jgi:CubicO group peptidase (beta-lactamase class C family)
LIPGLKTTILPAKNTSREDTMKHWKAALLLGALALGSCGQEAAPPVEDTQQPVFELTPTVIAMRWQLLNPQVNSFVFRELKQVFEYRDVRAGPDVQPLEQGQALDLPGYDAFAEATFTNAMLVMRDGKVVFEHYRNRMTPEVRHIAFSMSKTITAMLVGIALDKGEIKSLDDPAQTYVPQLAGTGYDGVTVRQILQMRSGVDYQERYDFGANPSFAGRLHEQAIVLNTMRFADGALETKRGNAPGSTFNYSTLDTMVLGWILEAATGETLEAQTQSRLWQPLGAQHEGFWLADGPPGTGRALNGMGYSATLRDFARLGQLLLDDGQRGDTRVLPEGWVAQMTAMQPTGGDMPGYGFQTWQIDREPGAYSAVGLAGQFIYVHPQSRTVIVKLSHYPPVEPENTLPDTVAFFRTITSAR